MSSEPQPTPDYEADEEAFMRTLEAFKDKHNRRYPAHSDILKVFKALGYKQKPGDNHRPS